MTKPDAIRQLEAALRRMSRAKPDRDAPEWPAWYGGYHNLMRKLALTRAGTEMDMRQVNVEAVRFIGTEIAGLTKRTLLRRQI